jgi:hypothetical protein
MSLSSAAHREQNALPRFGQVIGDATMSIANYEVVPSSSGWVIRHDDSIGLVYATKEAAFEAAMAAASLAIREGFEVHVSAPSREADSTRRETIMSSALHS